jgi:hypothetical protein
MPVEAHEPPVTSKTKAEKAQSYLSITSTTIGIIGAVGTAFVYLASTYFTGQVEINPDKPVQEMMVKVTDSKGHQSTYYTRYVSLMPGDYHLEFGIPDKKPTKHADAHVKVWERTIIPYTVPEELAFKEEPETKKKWWQFWKRGNNAESATK